MTQEQQYTCEGCGGDGVVLSQYGIRLDLLALDARFCSSCLHEELNARGLVPAPSGPPNLIVED